MNTRNLIPVKVVALKQRRRAARRWLLGNGAYAILLTAAWAISICSGSAITSHDTNQSLRVELNHSNATLKSLKQTSEILKSNLQSSGELTNRADWNLLLIAISRSLDQEIALKVLDCTPDPSPGKPSNARSTVWPESMRISGIARSQQSVTRFVLNLEHLRFFSLVRIVQTGSQSIGGHDAIGFDLICTFPRVAGQP